MVSHPSPHLGQYILLTPDMPWRSRAWAEAYTSSARDLPLDVLERAHAMSENLFTGILASTSGIKHRSAGERVGPRSSEAHDATHEAAVSSRHGRQPSTPFRDPGSARQTRRKEISDAALREVEDREIQAVVRTEEAIGLKAVTDGIPCARGGISTSFGRLSGASSGTAITAFSFRACRQRRRRSSSPAESISRQIIRCWDISGS